MEIVKDSEPELQSLAITPPNKFQAIWWPIKHKLQCWWLWYVWRKLPTLVWYGQDVDVTVTFSDLRLAPDCQGKTNPDGSVSWDIRYEGDMETLWKAEDALKQIGLSFDKGTGHTGRDWEWDWSLRGPVKLAFRKKHKGDRAPKEPRPPLKLITLSKDELKS